MAAMPEAGFRYGAGRHWTGLSDLPDCRFYITPGARATDWRIPALIVSKLIVCSSLSFLVDKYIGF